MNAWVNYDDVVKQLRDAGLLVKLPLELAKGSKGSRRCRVDGGDKELRGWYRLYEWINDDGEVMLTGSFGIFHGANANAQKIELTKRCESCGYQVALKEKACTSCGAKKFKRRELTDEQKEAFRARMAADRKRAEAEAQRRADEAARHAEHAWRKCLAVGESEYLKRKGIDNFGGRFSPAGNFVIPIMDAERRIHGLQVIYAKKKDGRDKDYWPAGLAKKGHFFQLGPIPDRLVLLCEGYATGATLHQATGYPVVVSFDANNLLPVAQAIRAKYKRANILVCADDDYLQKCKECRGWVVVAEPVCPHCGKQHLKDNPGVTHAKNAALAVDGSVVAPVFAADRPIDCKGPTDFNDLHAIEGLHVVTQQVEAPLSGLGWLSGASRGAGSSDPGGGEAARRQAVAVLELDLVVERFVPLDDGTGDYLFDLWTNKVVKKSQMLALLPAGVRGDDIKRHPFWINRGAYYLDQVGFDPSGKDTAVKLNTWKGWPMKPVRGCCDKLLDLLYYLCNADPNAALVYEWLLDWMAYPLQHPGAKMNSAVIMHGPQGTGKSTVFQALAKIYGDYATVLNQRGLEDKFNSDWADSKLFILAEEVVTRAEMWHIKNELKELVTGEWIRVNPKNIAAYRQRNQVNIVYLSNENQPLPLENDDRRHLVIYTPPALSENSYDEVQLEIENGGIAAFYDYLLNRDLSRFHPKKRPPMTEAKQRLIALSAASEMRFLTEWILGELDLPVCPALASDVYVAYLKWCRTNGETRPRPSNQFHGAVQHLQGWDKSKQRIYPSESAIETKPKPIITPPLDAVAKDGNAHPPGMPPARWLTDCVKKFAAAIGGAKSESERWSA